MSRMPSVKYILRARRNVLRTDGGWADVCISAPRAVLSGFCLSGALFTAPRGRHAVPGNNECTVGSSFEQERHVYFTVTSP